MRLEDKCVKRRKGIDTFNCVPSALESMTTIRSRMAASISDIGVSSRLWLTKTFVRPFSDCGEPVDKVFFLLMRATE